MILDNLISNSRKARANKVKVSVKSAGENFVDILVQDDGRGIKKEAMNNIFDLGYTTTSGSGLGLSQVKSKMDDLNGSIFYREGINGGAGFESRFTS